MSTWVLIVTAAIAGLVAGIATGYVVAMERCFNSGLTLGIRQGFESGLRACGVGAPKSIELRREWGMDQ